MAHLWIEDLPGEWAIMPLAQSRVAVSPRRLDLESGPVHADADPRRPAFVLIRGNAGHPLPWHLIAEPTSDLRVNGLPLVAGLRVLSDRDEIRVVGGDSWFFASHDLARTEPFPRTSTPITCARCRLPIDTDTPAVRCPQCGIWHHATAASPCYEYAPTCAMCPQPTAPGSGYPWTPAEL